MDQTDIFFQGIPLLQFRRSAGFTESTSKTNRRNPIASRELPDLSEADNNTATPRRRSIGDRQKTRIPRSKELTIMDASLISEWMIPSKTSVLKEKYNKYTAEVIAMTENMKWWLEIFKMRAIYLLENIASAGTLCVPQASSIRIEACLWAGGHSIY
jgi:hypothetical protein